MPRLVLGFVDQGLLSLFGLLLTVFGARTLSTDDFGVFAVVYGGYIIGLAVSRAFTGEVLVVLDPHPDRQGRGGSPDEQSALWVALAFSVLAGLVVGVGVSRVGQPQAAVAAALAVMLAMLMDTARFVHISRRSLGRLAAGDAVAPCAMLLLLVGLHGDLSLTSVFVVWASLSGSAVVALLVRSRVGQGHPSSAARWFVANLRRSGFFVTEALSSSIGYQLAILGVVAVLGSGLAAGLRAAQVFAGPVGVLYLGAITVLTRECVERRDKGAGLRRRMLLLSVGLSLVALALAAVVAADLLGVPSALLEDQWPEAQPYVWPAMAYAAFSMLNLAPVILLRAGGAYAVSLRARIVTTSLLVVLAFGAAFLGELAVAWALALANGVGVLLWWRGLRRGAPTLAAAAKGEAWS